MKRLLIFILPVVLLASCAKSLDEYNIDQKNPKTVSAGSLFGNALKQLTTNQTTPSVNINVFRFWTQQWTATTYQDEPRYDITTRNIPLNYWTPFYREVLQDLKESKRLTEADATLAAPVKNNRIAVTEIAAVYAWSVLVNTWGDVPYFEALTDQNRPKYDKGADIYADLFKRLDAAIAQMTPGANFGDVDLLYKNNTGAWIKFAHSLRLKLAITLADVDPAKAQSVIQASADKAFASNADNAAFKYLGQTPNNNPVSNSLNAIFTSRQDYVAGATLVDKMNALADPRRPYFFTTVKANADDLVGKYIGGQIGESNGFDDYSHVSDMIIKPDFEALLMDYSEVEFILAEAAARWGIAGSAADHYEKAIKASISYYAKAAGASDTQIAAETDAYLKQPAVAYATAKGNYKEKIGEQKYIALYNRGYDSWVEWKRLDFPVLKPATEAESVIPLRLTYPSSERTLNQANVESASAALGGDEVDKKVFWDKF